LIEANALPLSQTANIFGTNAPSISLIARANDYSDDRSHLL